MAVRVGDRTIRDGWEGLCRIRLGKVGRLRRFGSLNLEARGRFAEKNVCAVRIHPACDQETFCSCRLQNGTQFLEILSEVSGIRLVKCLHIKCAIPECLMEEMDVLAHGLRSSVRLAEKFLKLDP